MPRLVRTALLAWMVSLFVVAPLAAAPARQAVPVATHAPLSSAFTYQGRLEKAGGLVTAACSMSFALFDAASAGNQIGNTQTLNPVHVSQGLFTVTLNDSGQFGANAFDGNARFLEISLLCAGDASATTLPRQQLHAAPYAITALSTEALQGHPVSTTAPDIGQTLTWDGSAWIPQTPTNVSAWSSLSGVPAGFADDVDNDSGGDIMAVAAGSGLVGGGETGEVALSLDTATTDTRYWRLGGNANVPDDATLGATNNTALTLVTNNAPALRLLPATVPNLLGGASANRIAAGVSGATIAGGGATLAAAANRIFDSFGVLGGGTNNVVGVDDSNVNNQHAATVAGGEGNRALAAFATVGGGTLNQASARAATIPGGDGALATLPGQFAYASGAFGADESASGSAQMAMYVLRGEGAGDVTLTLDGAGEGIALRPGMSMAVSILLVGRSTTETEITAAYRIDGAVAASDSGGSTEFANFPAPFLLLESDFPIDLSATATATDGVLTVTALNGTGHEMRWVATVLATEVVEE